MPSRPGLRTGPPRCPDVALIALDVGQMRPNWRRGLFRLWLFTSILWVLGVLGYLMYSSVQDLDLAVRLNCSNPREGFHQCYTRMATYEGRWLHHFEQSGPPVSPSGWQRGNCDDRNCKKTMIAQWVTKILCLSIAFTRTGSSSHLDQSFCSSLVVSL
jgi:hypothetical protein